MTIRLFKDSLADATRHKLSTLFEDGILTEDTEVAVRRAGHPKVRAALLEMMRDPEVAAIYDEARPAVPEVPENAEEILETAAALEAADTDEETERLTIQLAEDVMTRPALLDQLEKQVRIEEAMVQVVADGYVAEVYKLPIEGNAKPWDSATEKDADLRRANICELVQAVGTAPFMAWAKEQQIAYDETIGKARKNS